TSRPARSTSTPNGAVGVPVLLQPSQPPDPPLMSMSPSSSASTVTVPVAVLDTSPSTVTWYVKLSSPTNSASAVYVTVLSAQIEAVPLAGCDTMVTVALPGIGLPS